MFPAKRKVHAPKAGTGSPGDRYSLTVGESVSLGEPVLTVAKKLIWDCLTSPIPLLLRELDII